MWEQVVERWLDFQYAVGDVVAAAIIWVYDFLEI